MGEREKGGEDKVKEKEGEEGVEEDRGKRNR